MAVREILQLGDPRLREKCARVEEPGTAEVAALIDDMRDTLAHWRKTTGYGRGIAAPQLGVMKRVIFLKLPFGQPSAGAQGKPYGEPRAGAQGQPYGEPRAGAQGQPYGEPRAGAQGKSGWSESHKAFSEGLALINPEIVERSDEEIVVWDACLSFLCIFMQVERHKEITVRYQGANGDWQEIRAGVEQDLSELLQHEIDHLDGVLCIDRVKDVRTICTKDEFEKRYRMESPYAEKYSGE